MGSMNTSTLIVIILVLFGLFCLYKKNSFKGDYFTLEEQQICDAQHPCPKGQACAFPGETRYGTCVSVPKDLPCQCKENSDCKDGYVCRKYIPPGTDPKDAIGECLRKERPSAKPCDARIPSSCPVDQKCIWAGGPGGTCVWKYSC